MKRHPLIVTVTVVIAVTVAITYAAAHRHWRHHLLPQERTLFVEYPIGHVAIPVGFNSSTQVAIPSPFSSTQKLVRHYIIRIRKIHHQLISKQEFKNKKGPGEP